MTIREIVTDLLDNSPEAVFSLWGLADTVGLRKGGGHWTKQDACVTMLKVRDFLYNEWTHYIGNFAIYKTSISTSTDTLVFFYKEWT